MPTMTVTSFSFIGVPSPTSFSTDDPSYPARALGSNVNALANLRINFLPRLGKPSLLSRSPIPGQRLVSIRGFLRVFYGRPLSAQKEPRNQLTLVSRSLARRVVLQNHT